MEFENDTNSRSIFLVDPTIYLDGYLCASHFTCAAIGIPINFLLMGFITGLERLRSQRHVIWLSVGFSNIFVLLFHLMEMLATHWASAPAEKICAWLYGLPYMALFLNHFLSFIERHLCLKHSKWYKTHVTNGWIVSVQIGSFLLLGLIIKGHLIFGSAQDRSGVQWKMNPAQVGIVSSIILAWFILCLVGQTAVWIHTSRKYPSAAVCRLRMQRLAVSSNGNVVQSIDDDVMDDNCSSQFVQIGEERISRLELEAGRSVTISGVALLITATPALVTLILVAACLTYYVPVEELKSCSQLTKIFFYLRGLIPVYCSSIDPALFVTCRREIRSALRDKVFVCRSSVIPAK